MEALYHVAATLGLRQGELLGLSWQDLDFGAGVLTVQANLQWHGGAYHRDEVKTARSRRTIGLAPELTEIFRHHQARQKFEQQRREATWVGNDWDLIFTGRDGTPLHGTRVTRAFQRQLAAAGLPKKRFHDLRHGAASYMLAEGASLSEVQRVLGHSTITVTNDVYGHITVDATREATRRVGDLLSRTS